MTSFSHPNAATVRRQLPIRKRLVCVLIGSTVAYSVIVSQSSGRRLPPFPSSGSGQYLTPGLSKRYIYFLEHKGCLCTDGLSGINLFNHTLGGYDGLEMVDSHHLLIPYPSFAFINPLELRTVTLDILNCQNQLGPDPRQDSTPI